MTIKGKKRSKGSLLRIFMNADGIDKLLMMIGFSGAVGDGITTPASYFIASKFVNHVGATNTVASSQDFRRNINKIALIMFYIGCVKWIACFLAGYCWTRTAERQASTLRASYLKAVLRQDVGYFDLHVTSTAEVIESVSSDSLVIQDVISEKVPVFLMNVSMFIGCYVVAFLMVWRLTLVAFPFILLLIIPGMIYGRAIMVIGRKIRDEYGKGGSIVEQAVSSIRTVYSFVGETKTVADYSAALEGAFKLGLSQGLAKGLAIGSNGIALAITSFMAYYGSRLVMYHGAKGGSVYMVCVSVANGGLIKFGVELTIILLYLWSYCALGSGLSYVKNLSEASAAADRIMEMMERAPEIDSKNMAGETLGNVSGEIDFRHVEFTYPSRPETKVLKGFNLRIPAGKTAALVGQSGSGKSTVIALLQRFYDPSGGEICLDGLAIDKFQIKFLRSQMGLVSQEPALFGVSIKENILFGMENASIDEVIEAAKASNAHSFIAELPRGYDTQVGEGGVQMSGGQRQRIAIARAIIKAPKVLLLDEATSALDSESERIVQDALDKAAVGRTTIIVAHRLSTIRNADLIAVVQNGQIAEIGSHDELAGKQNGMYASLVRVQQTETTKPLIHKSKSAETLGFISGKTMVSARLTDPSNETEKNTPSSTLAPSFSRLLAMNSPEWKQALAGCIGAILFGAVQPTFSLIMGSVIQVYFLLDHDEMKNKIRIFTLCFAGLAVFSFVTGVCQHYSFAVMGECLTKRIRRNMLSKILTFEIGWFNREENSTGAICSRLSIDANVVRSLVGDRMSFLIQTISAVTTAFTMGLVISWKFAIVIIAIQPLIIICVYWRRVLLKTMSEKSTKAQEESSKIAAEAVSNIRIVASFNSETKMLQMLEKAQIGPRLENIRQSWFAGFCLGTCNCLVIMNWGFAFWYGGKLFVSGSIKAEALFQNILILLTTGRVIGEAATMTNDLAKGSEAVKSVFAVLDRFSSIEPEDQENYKPDELTGDVELRGVDFSYPSRPDVVIFKDFSLKIMAGKSMALVGQSGSGKSTIINLIERFYDPVKGSVEIDCRDVRSYHLRALRKHIALVSQEPALFAGTVRENIAYGESKTTDESEIVEAAKIANAHNFITGLKDGYDTWCGDKGLQLSGGQKQRIAIARAVLKNPRILLLDEATSALDSQSEKVVQDALEKVMMGRTSVMVAHRLSTIRDCDMIAVLHKGRVVEKGTHMDLLDLGPDGIYSSLVSLQMTSTHTII